MALSSTSPFAFVKKQWDTLEQTGYTSKEAWDALGVQSTDRTATSVMQATVTEIARSKISPVYDPKREMFIYPGKEGPLAYFKVGTLRAHTEPALRRVAHSLGLEETVAPCAAWVIKPKDFPQGIEISSLDVVKQSYRKANFVSALECVPFSEETPNGHLVQYLLASEGEDAIPTKSVRVFSRALLGVLSPTVLESSAERTHAAFLRFSLSMSVLGMRDLNTDGMVWDGKAFVLVDGEEGFAAAPKDGNLPTLDGTYLRDHLALANPGANPETLAQLQKVVRVWDPERVGQEVSQLKFNFRDLELEQVNAQSANARKLKPKSIDRSGQRVLVCMSSREEVFFPSRSIEDSALLHPSQVAALKKRMQRIQSCLLQQQPKSAAAAFPLFNAWTLLFSADPPYSRRVVGAWKARKNILKQPAKDIGKDLRHRFRHLRLDSNEDVFLTRMAEAGGDLESPFPPHEEEPSSSDFGDLWKA